MELSFLEFRYRKQFFGMTAFFLGLLVDFWSGFLQVFCITEHNLPYPQRLFGGSGLIIPKMFCYRNIKAKKFPIFMKYKNCTYICTKYITHVHYQCFRFSKRY